MSFREKITWLTLGSMVVAYSIYFALLPTAQPEGSTSAMPMIMLFVSVTILQAIIVAVTAAILAVRSTTEANAGADERERAIDRRGAAGAYYVLLVGMIVVGIVMPFNAAGWHITNAALLALVTAEAVRHGLVLLSYRRGWHG